MNAKRLDYTLSALMGGLLGAFAGFVASMWGGIEVILPVLTIAGAMLGISLAYIIELIILAIY